MYGPSEDWSCSGCLCGVVFLFASFYLPANWKWNKRATILFFNRMIRYRLIVAMFFSERWMVIWMLSVVSCMSTIQPQIGRSRGVVDSLGNDDKNNYCEKNKTIFKMWGQFYLSHFSEKNSRPTNWQLRNTLQNMRRGHDFFEEKICAC